MSNSDKTSDEGQNCRYNKSDRSKAVHLLVFSKIWVWKYFLALATVSQARGQFPSSSPHLKQNLELETGPDD
ncbi:MAG: hypothetical protein SW833_02460 [Cyanobacteriota bacterium]|nr:hypothetical protein [Cyanobacteriota bacterium]